MMKLELLPNEILLDLFDYFDGGDLLRAFYGLNSRFNFLLYQQFRAYRFNFYRGFKLHFDMICQQHLPCIADRVISLSLFDNDRTPEQINLFCSYMSFSKFIHLRSLTLSASHSSQTWIKIVDEFHHLSNLTHLEFNSIFCLNDQAELQLIVNKIWSLPKLIYCYFTIFSNKIPRFCLPTKLSTCLKDLYIDSNTLNQIYRLFEYTPRLRRLSILIETKENEDFKSYTLPTLIDLAIHAFGISNTSKMISLLKNTPNLRCLDIHLRNNLINGKQWEQIIYNHLPKLKVFQLHMKYTFSNDESIEERVDELINSYQSPFWIDEHKWFVRCFTYDKSIHLETLSKTFYGFENKLPNSCKSTYPDDDHQKFYNTIVSINHKTFFEQPIPSYIRLQNIYSLSVNLPINDQFGSIVTSLNRLGLLYIYSNNDTFQSQLQTLLNDAPHLRSLHISQDKSLPLQTSLFKYTNTAVRQLSLENYGHYFNEKECTLLSHSPLGVQCEVLSIQVKNRESIIILVQNMNNLQALYVKYENEKDSERVPWIMNDDEPDIETISEREETIQWLKEQLPSTCLISKGFDSGPVSDMNPYPINGSRTMVGAESIEVQVMGFKHSQPDLQ